MYIYTTRTGMEHGTCMLAIYMSKLVSLEPIIVGASLAFGQKVQQVPQINEHVTRLLWMVRPAGRQTDRQTAACWTDGLVGH